MFLPILTPWAVDYVALPMWPSSHQHAYFSPSLPVSLLPVPKGTEEQEPTLVKYSTQASDGTDLPHTWPLAHTLSITMAA